MSREPIILSWSGGKDSCLTLAALQDRPDVEVVALLTSVTRDYDRISIHGVRRELLEAQARSLGLPVHEIRLSPGCSNAEYEAAFHRALAEIRERHPDVRRIAFGDLFLEDVRAYRERLLETTAFAPMFPIWGEDTRALARRFVAAGFQARLVCVDTTQLDARFAGRLFDDSLLDELPESVDACGERGEFHTFVADGPPFAHAVEYRVGELVLRDERFAYCDLVAAPEGLPPANQTADAEASD